MSRDLPHRPPRDDETLLSGQTDEPAPAGGPAPRRATRTGELGGFEGGGAQVLAGRYQIVAVLGGGAMGSVYRARDLELGEEVALKLLRAELLDSAAMVERFRNEVKLARRVTHRNVARTFDIGEHAGERFLTMEFIDGEPLSHRLHREGPLPLAAVVEIGAALCAGLGAAHGAGVVHRDLKPDNILCARDGRVVITDFGIARGVFGTAAAQRTQGGILGTPAYMAPEQVEALPEIDARADVYALGCMLFEMLTGEVPFDADSPYAVALQRILRPPPDPRERRPDVPAAAAEIVLRCMARRPEDRFASVAEVAAALGRLTQPLPAPAPPAQSSHPAPTAAPAPAQTEVSVPAHLPAALSGPTTGATASGTGALGSGPLSRSVAVLPLRNGGPPEDDYLAAGLSEDLTDALSMAPGLRVRPRGAVLAAVRAPDLSHGADADPQELGRRLGVEVVVEGSLRRAGDRVRIQVRLTSVAEGFQIWAQRFDRPAADVLAVSDEAAAAITTALRPAGATQVSGPPAAAGARAPADPRAVDLYLRARHAYHQPNATSTMLAVDLAEQALAIAPDDPAVLTLYALSRARLWFMGGEESEERARAAAERAQQAAPGRGEPLLALASVLYQGGDLAGAVGKLRQAIVLSPALAEAHEFLGRILCETGPIERGISELQTALRLDPALLRAHVDLARAYLLRGEREEALTFLQRVKAMPDSDFGWITQGRIAVWLRDRELAAEVLRHPKVASGDMQQTRFVAEFVLNGGFSGDLERFLANWEAGPRSSARARAFFQQLRTEVYGFLGQVGPAMEALRRSVEAGLTDLLWVQLCPALAPLRADPRYAALEETVAERARLIRAAL